MDLEMPDMDGEETACAIRADATLAALPVVLLSSRGRRSSPAEWRAKGFAAALVKPVRRSQLIAAIGEALGAEVAPQLRARRRRG